ncbi:MAG: hypothetical protein KAQ64_04535 [Candidatus Pacebacteria bacterium]|nr:hypothetical protein [Candidatus Paceibacterota bacterium]
MNIKYIKYYSSFAVLALLVSAPAKAMELHYFTKDIAEVFNDSTKILLIYAGRLVLLFLIIGGVYYVISGSDPQKQENAKKVITYAIFGLVVILISYAVIVSVGKIGTTP